MIFFYKKIVNTKTQVIWNGMSFILHEKVINFVRITVQLINTINICLEFCNMLDE